MIPAAYKAFIEKIIEKTNDEDTKWIHTSERGYALKTATSTIEIGYYADADAELSYYYFKFYSFKQKTDAGFRVSSAELDFSIMEQLYSVAGASAANIKSELSSFLDDL